MFTHLVRSFTMYLILTALITIICAIELPPRTDNALYSNKSIFTNTHFAVVYLVCFVYSIQVTTFTILLAQFFSRR